MTRFYLWIVIDTLAALEESHVESSVSCQPFIFKLLITQEEWSIILVVLLGSESG